MLYIHYRLGYRCLDAVRDEGGYNLGEQVFVFYKEKRDVYIFTNFFKF